MTDISRDLNGIGRLHCLCCACPGFVKIRFKYLNIMEFNFFSMHIQFRGFDNRINCIHFYSWIIIFSFSQCVLWFMDYHNLSVTGGWIMTPLNSYNEMLCLCKSFCKLDGWKNNSFSGCVLLRTPKKKLVSVIGVYYKLF